MDVSHRAARNAYALIVLGAPDAQQLASLAALAAQFSAAGWGNTPCVWLHPPAGSAAADDAWLPARDWQQALTLADAERLIVCSGVGELPVEVLRVVARDLPQNQLLVGATATAPGWRAAIWTRVIHWISRGLMGTAASPIRPSALFLQTSELQTVDLAALPTECMSAAIAVLRAEGWDLPESTWATRRTGASERDRGLSASGLPGRALALLRQWWQVLKFPAQRTENETPAQTGLGWWAWPVLIAVALLTLSVNLRYPLFEPDEARNAQLGINIVETGQWMALELGGEPYWDKPPLVPWLIATSYTCFGVSEFSTRLPGNLAALALVICVYAWGRRFVGARAAWLAALGLVLTCGFTICSRYVTMDSALALSATVTLWAAYFACLTDRFSYRWWLTSAVAGGLGLLIKGPIVAVVTLPVLIAVHVLEGNRSLWHVRRWLAYLAVVGVIAAPWYLAMGWVQPEFLVYFFWRHNVVRFSDAFNHDEPWWFYLPILFVVLFPVSYLLPTLGRVLGSNQPQFRRERSRHLGILTLSALWILGFFSLSQSKLPTYILPAFPALALLLGYVLDRFVLVPQSLALANPWVRWIPCRASRLLLGLFLVGAMVYHFWLAPPGSPSGAVIAVIGLGMGGATWLAGARTKQPTIAWASFAVVTLLWIHWSNTTLLPAISSYRSVHQAMWTVRERPEYVDVPLVFYCHESYGAELWLNEEGCLEFRDEDRHRLRDYLIRERKVLLVAREEPLEIVRDSLPWPLTITKVPGARHLYLCAERDHRSRAPQIAERYRPAAAIWR